MNKKNINLIRNKNTFIFQTINYRQNFKHDVPVRPCWKTDQYYSKVQYFLTFENPKDTLLEFVHFAYQNFYVLSLIKSIFLERLKTIIILKLRTNSELLKFYLSPPHSSLSLPLVKKLCSSLRLHKNC